MKENKHQLTLKKYKGLYYEQLYANKMGNLDKMDKFLITCSVTKLNQEE